MEITSINQLDTINGVYSYADYLLWKIKKRVELFKGKIFEMSAPSPTHQEISFKLSGQFYIFFQQQQCKVFTAPFDVRLSKQNSEDDKIQTVVQPDLCVVCDVSKIDGKGCLGAPDLIVEILSPGNSKKEMKYKFELYQDNGVKEYWIIDPDRENVSIFILKDEEYIGLAPVVNGENITSHLFPNLEINTAKIFS